MNPQTVEARYQLTILNFPDTRVIPQICKLIYQTEDKNLIASLSTLPYIVGRSFSPAESESLHTALRQIKVGHRFHSENAPSMSFDPHLNAAAKSAEPTPKIVELRNRMPKSPSRKIVFSVLAVAGLSAGIGIYLMTPRKQHASNTPAVHFEARVESLSHDVEYRIANDLIWKKAEPNLALQSQDSLRTFQNSTAKLRYREGSQVTVMPNTLMIIGKLEEENKKSIKLEDGSVQARMKASEKPNHLSIETASGTLEMTAPKLGGAKESKVETSVSGGKLTVSVTQGQATLTPKAKNISPVTIGNLQQITATQDSISAPIKFIPTIHLIEPKLNTKIILDPQKSSPVIFHWEALDEAAEYELLLSSDPEMKEVFLRQKSLVPSVELTYIDIGKVYWQVTGVIDDVNYQSPVWPIYVQKSDN